jgi:hypothetical protein
MLSLSFDGTLTGINEEVYLLFHKRAKRYGICRHKIVINIMPNKKFYEIVFPKELV